MAAQTLYVASYAGVITQLGLEASELKHVSKTEDWDTCWLTFDRTSAALYSLGEGSADPKMPGSLSAFTVGDSGALTLRDKSQTINGPVALALHGSHAGLKGLTLAHYGGGAVSTFSVSQEMGLHLQGQAFFEFPGAPGPVRDRQEASHPHGCTVDPSGRFVLVPDLGMDMVRVFSTDTPDGQIKECRPLRAAAGSGPRHAVFWSSPSTAASEPALFLYLVGELTATVTGYQATYDADGKGMSFREMFSASTLGDRKSPPSVLSAEIAVSPDKRFLLVSNRFDGSFPSSADGYAVSSDKVPSDSIASWSLLPDGRIASAQLAPAGGRVPRHFQMSPSGDKIAVALQDDHRVVILQRDVETGQIGPEMASTTVSEKPTCVVWA